VTRRASVLLIREEAEPAGGCCRIPQSALDSPTKDPAFANQRAIIERMGAIYQHLRQGFGRAIEVQVVDPRNIALPILLIRDFLAHRVRFRDGLRTLANLPMHAVIVNGRIVDDSEAPDAGAVLDVVRAAVSPTAG
jgi:hypothetical protein